MTEWVELNPPERMRKYIFPKKEFIVKNVVRIKVSEFGTHYLETSDNNLRHIIFPGWIAITLDVDDWTF